MKQGLIHVCFVIDSSGSMYGSVKDVIGGFEKTIEEQKKVKDGECIVSMYTFASDVKQIYLGKNINDIGKLEYQPSGMTKLLDGVGRAIDEIGEWLAGKPEEERPSKNLIVIITDGEENYSTDYTREKVKEMITHQETKYNWTFVFLGADLTNVDDARSLGITNIACNTKSDFSNNYDFISSSASLYRSCADAVTADACLKAYVSTGLTEMNAEYELKTGIKIDD